MKYEDQLIWEIYQNNFLVEQKSNEYYTDRCYKFYLQLLKIARDSSKRYKYFSPLVDEDDKIIGISISVGKFDKDYDDLVIELYNDPDKDTGKYGGEFIDNNNETGIPNILEMPFLAQYKDHMDILLSLDDDECVDYFSKHITKFLPTVTLLHEFTHYLDYKLNGLSDWDMIYIDDDFEDEGILRKYHNSSQEILAELISGFHDYRNDIQRGTYDTFDKFKDSFIDYKWNEGAWDKYMTDETKNYILKQLHTFYKSKSIN